MSKLYDKNDPNQLKEDQAPYGDEAGNDSSAAAIHGRVVRLETNAKHVATNEGLARVEGKVDEAKAELKGEIKSGNAKLKGEIDTGKAETDTKFAKVYAKLGLVEKLLYATITLLVFVIIKDSPTISGLFAQLLAKILR